MVLAFADPDLMGFNPLPTANFPVRSPPPLPAHNMMKVPATTNDDGPTLFPHRDFRRLAASCGWRRLGKPGDELQTRRR